MTATAPYLSAAAAILKRDLQLMLSYRFRLVSQFLTTAFTLTLFYYISRLVNVQSFSSPDAYYAFAVVGIITLQIINSTLLAPPMMLRQELVAGTFERLAVSPFGPANGIVSMVLFPMVQTLITVLAMIVFSAAVFGLQLEWPSALAAIPIGAVAAVAFLPFGVGVLAIVMVAKQAAAGANWVVALMSLVAGLYFPVALLPGWLEWLSEVQPFTAAADLIRHFLVGIPLPDPLWLDLVRLIAFPVLLLPPSIWLLGRAIEASRRRGTIIEY
jgi:ABC-2 type transport system permease protein